jgi:hypothetical protein
VELIALDSGGALRFASFLTGFAQKVVPEHLSLCVGSGFAA